MELSVFSKFFIPHGLIPCFCFLSMVLGSFHWRHCLQFIQAREYESLCQVALYILLLTITLY